METSDGIMPKGRKSEMLSFYITIKTESTEFKQTPHVELI